MRGLSVKNQDEIRDRFKVKAFCLFLIITTGLAAQAQTSLQTSFVYQCHFTDEINATSALRMKEYFDSSTNTELGKVDLLVSGEVKESVQTQILEVPIWESDTYVKMWYSPQVRIDAILSWSTSSREFAATYLKNSIRKPIYCSRISD
ncbi:hypothetical protein D3C87_1166070 [compost metagenome]